MEQPSGVGVVQCVGNGGNQFRRIPNGRSNLSNPDRQIAPFDELRDHEAETIVGASHVVDRNDVGMIKARNDAGFIQVCLDIFRARDSLGSWDFDRNRAIKIVIESQENLTEPALPKPSEDRVTSDLRRMKKGKQRLGILTGGLHILS